MYFSGSRTTAGTQTEDVVILEAPLAAGSKIEIDSLQFLQTPRVCRRTKKSASSKPDADDERITVLTEGNVERFLAGLEPGDRIQGSEAHRKYMHFLASSTGLRRRLRDVGGDLKFQEKGNVFLERFRRYRKEQGDRAATLEEGMRQVSRVLYYVQRNTPSAREDPILRPEVTMGEDFIRHVHQWIEVVRGAGQSDSHIYKYLGKLESFCTMMSRKRNADMVPAPRFADTARDHGRDINDIKARYRREGAAAHKANLWEASEHFRAPSLQEIQSLVTDVRVTREVDRVLSGEGRRLRSSARKKSGEEHEEYLLVVRYLAACLVIKNFKRMGVATTFLLGEFRRSVQRPEDDWYTFSVKKHKTSQTYGPTAVCLQSEDYLRMEGYAKNLRRGRNADDSPFFTDFLADKAINPNSLRLTSYVTQVKKMFGEDFTPLKGLDSRLVRKVGETFVDAHDTGADLRDFSSFLDHSKRVAEKDYVLEGSRPKADRAYRIVSKLLSVDHARLARSEQAADSGGKLRVPYTTVTPAVGLPPPETDASPAEKDSPKWRFQRKFFPFQFDDQSPPAKEIRSLLPGLERGEAKRMHDRFWSHIHSRQIETVCHSMKAKGEKLPVDAGEMSRFMSRHKWKPSYEKAVRRAYEKALATTCAFPSWDRTGFGLSLDEAILKELWFGLRAVKSDDGDRGRFVVARQSFKQGQVVCDYPGERLNRSEARRLPDKEFLLELSVETEHLALDAPWESETGHRYGRLINHSRNHANLVPCRYGEDKVIFVCLRDIGAGEEVTFDYGYDKSPSRKDDEELPPWYGDCWCLECQTD